MISRTYWKSRFDRLEAARSAAAGKFDASAKIHISRLEALNTQVQNTVQKLYGKFNADAADKFAGMYTDGYEKAMYEIQKGVQVAWNVPAPDPRRLEKVLSKPWKADGATFSDRIWRQQDMLIDALQKQMTHSLILGRSPKDSIAALAKETGVSRSQAGRLIMTESAYFGNLGLKDGFGELGVEEFQVLETFDSATCTLCGKFDGEHFPMSKFEVGVNAPPFHPNCRGCISPWFEDETGERFARDAEDKATTVPGDVTFEQWRERFLGDGLPDEDKKETMDKPEAPTPVPVPSSGWADKNNLQNDAESGILNNGGGESVLDRTLHKIENEIKDLDYEESAILGRKGNILHQGTDRAQGSVNVPSDLIKDNIVTHNHPNGILTFSINDTRIVTLGGAQSVRAVTSSGKFIELGRVDNKPNSSFLEGAIRNEYGDRGTAGVLNEWLKENAGRFGFYFKEGDI